MSIKTFPNYPKTATGLYDTWEALVSEVNDRAEEFSALLDKSLEDAPEPDYSAITCDEPFPVEDTEVFYIRSRVVETLKSTITRIIHEYAAKPPLPSRKDAELLDAGKPTQMEKQMSTGFDIMYREWHILQVIFKALETDLQTFHSLYTFRKSCA